MGRIGASLSGIERSLLNRLAEANAAATLSRLRMATGSKINSPKDDPSAFVALSGFQSRLSNVQAVTSNVTAASSMVTQTQSTLDNVRTQLTAIRTELLTDEDRTLSANERTTAQAKIDTAIAQINALAGEEIDGRRVLDGSADFSASGRNTAQIADLKVYQTGGGTATISGTVHQAATQASLVYTGDASDQVTDTATITLTGASGSIAVSVTAGQDLSAVETEINKNSHKTGITASLDTGTHELTFTSVEYGSNASAQIAVNTGTFIVAAGSTTSDSGTDANATLNNLYYVGDGNRFNVAAGGAHYQVEFEAGFSGTFDTVTVDGDALTFAFSPDLAAQSTLAIAGVQAPRLGGLSGSLSDLAAGGSLAGLDGNTSQAIRVVDEALADLAVIEGNVDGFYDASVTSATNLLSDMETDLETAIDDIDLVDNYEESAREAYYLDLASNAVAGLAVMQSQRSSIVNLIQAMAGLT